MHPFFSCRHVHFLGGCILGYGGVLYLNYLVFLSLAVLYVIAEVKCIWKAMRDGFRRKWNTAQGASGASASEVRIKHPYATELMFLSTVFHRCE